MVSTFNDNSEFVIKIKTNTEDRIFGTCSNKEKAIQLLKCVGKDEFKHAKNTFDPKWTKTFSHFDEKTLVYRITYQNLGMIKMVQSKLIQFYIWRKYLDYLILNIRMILLLMVHILR